MIETRTPFRLAFLGGTAHGADAMIQEGAVLTSTIDKYVLVKLRPLPAFSNPRYIFHISGRRGTAHTIDEIQHPTIRACFQYLDVSEAVELHLEPELPCGTGIGSRCSCTIGILHALYCLRKKRITKSALVEAAIHVEQEIMGEDLGSQDQTAVAYGGFILIRYSGHRGRSISLESLDIDPIQAETLSNRLMLFYLGSGKQANEHLGERTEQRPLRPADFSELNQLVDRAREILMRNHTPDDFGWLLHDSWQLDLRLRDELVPPSVERLYNKAQYVGALGGRLLGSRGLGFILFYVPMEKQDTLKRALKLHHVPFGFDPAGTKLINRHLTIY